MAENRPLASRRGKRTTWSEDLEDFGMAGRGLADMLASALRGATVGTIGMPGDIESMFRSKGTQILPTSEDVSGYLPPVREGEKPSVYEDIGGFIPTNAGKVLAKAAPALAGASKASIFLPLKIKKDVPNIARNTKATQDFRAGASPQEIWEKHRVFAQEDPLRTKNELPVWLTETPASEPYYNPERLMPPEQKEYIAGMLRRMGNTQHIEMQKRPDEYKKFMEAEYPKPMVHTAAKNVINHPAFQQVPEIGEIKLSAYPKGMDLPSWYEYAEGPLGPIGSHHSRKDAAGGWMPGRIAIHPRALFEPDVLGPGGTKAAYEHELQHGVQNLFGLPKGMHGRLSESEKDALKRIYEQSPQSAATFENVGSEPAKIIAMQLRGISPNAFKNYQNVVGERQARLAEQRMLMSPQERRLQGPASTLTSTPPNIEQLPLDSMFYNKLLQQFEYQPDTNLTDYLSQLLRKPK